MRITFITPAFDLSGGQRVIATYAERLQRRGHSVLVVAPPHGQPGMKETLRSILWKRRWPSRSSASHFDGTNVECRILGQSGPVTAADVPDADVVIASWWETAEWVMALPPSKGAKIYFLQHYEVFEYTPAERSKATWRFPMKKIVVARWLADLARDHHGDHAAVLVPNAVDENQFFAEPRGKQVGPTVGMMYSSIAFKRCEIVLEAVRLASQHLPDLQLVAFGQSEVYPWLPLPPRSEYFMAPPQDRIRNIYSRCDAWLFGSRTEGFGLPILEAMACRTPVIGTPAGAAPELLAGGGGCLVKTEDPHDMAEAIVRLCSLSESQWRTMSDAAYATATRYTWDDATDLFELALIASCDGTDADKVSATREANSG